MTRLPAPAWVEYATGKRSHRVSRLYGGGSMTHALPWGVTRCGDAFFTNGTHGTLTAEPTRPVCRVCEPKRRREP